LPSLRLSPSQWHAGVLGVQSTTHGRDITCCSFGRHCALRLSSPQFIFQRSFLSFPAA
jgi:hypothetical protein